MVVGHEVAGVGAQHPALGIAPEDTTRDARSVRVVGLAPDPSHIVGDVSRLFETGGGL